MVVMATLVDIKKALGQGVAAQPTRIDTPPPGA